MTGMTHFMSFRIEVKVRFSVCKDEFGMFYLDKISYFVFNNVTRFRGMYFDFCLKRKTRFFKSIKA